MSGLDNGEEIDLRPYYENLSRRDFLKTSGFATAAFTVPSFVKRTYGAEPEGKIIVKKKDIEGRPAVVEKVDPERFRRIKAYKHFEPRKLEAKGIAGATLRQRSEDRTDLVIQIGIDVEERWEEKGTETEPQTSTGLQKKDVQSDEIAEAADLPKRPRKLNSVEWSRRFLT